MRFFASAWLLSVWGMFILVAGIGAQDATSNVVFPSQANATALEVGNKLEAPFYAQDPSRNSAPFVPQPMVSSEYYVPENLAYRGPLIHRSESLPYGYEYPAVSYPIVHGGEHSIGSASSKHLLLASFIGLLLLFAIIQNTIIASKRKDALIDLPTSRRKRELYSTDDFDSVNPEALDILNDDARVRCIQRTICLENQRLFKDLGATGKILAKYLTRDVEKSVEPYSGWDRLVEDAGSAGIRGEDCKVLYRDCNLPVSTRASRRKTKNPGKSGRIRRTTERSR